MYIVKPNDRKISMKFPYMKSCMVNILHCKLYTNQRTCWHALRVCKKRR